MDSVVLLYIVSLALIVGFSSAYSSKCLYFICTSHLDHNRFFKTQEHNCIQVDLVRNHHILLNIQSYSIYFAFC